MLWYALYADLNLLCSLIQPHCSGNNIRCTGWRVSSTGFHKTKTNIFLFFFFFSDPFLDSDNAGLKCAVCIALGEITKHAALPLPSGGDGDAAGEITKLSLVNKLIGMIKTTKETNKVCLPLQVFLM